MSVQNIVHSVRNIMRKDSGVDGDAQRISEMTWMIFLKVFDSMEEEKEAEDPKYKSPLPEEVRWRNWASDEEGITGDELYGFVNNEVFVKLKGLSDFENKKAMIVKQVFEETNTYMKSGVLMRQVINEINKIDFTSSKDRHLFNEIYETILKELQNAGSAGEFYTPRAVTQFIVDIVNPKLGDIVLDPACGTGGFLVSSIENIKKGIKNIEDLNLLGKNIRGIEKNFPSEFQTRETADLFLILIMKLLRDEGRCGIVLPDGFLFGEGVKTRIKEKLLSEFNLHTIVRLPNGVFNPYTGIRTNLLFFEKGKPTKEIWYFEHPLPDSYKTYNKGKPINIKEFDLEKEWWNDRENKRFEKNCWRVSFENIEKRNFNLDINNPNGKIEEENLSSKEILEKLEESFEKSKKLIEKIKEEI